MSFELWISKIFKCLVESEEKNKILVKSSLCVVRFNPYEGKTEPQVIIHCLMFLIFFLSPDEKNLADSQSATKRVTPLPYAVANILHFYHTPPAAPRLGDPLDS